MLLDPIKLGPIEIKNRIVMPPMCTYSSEDGLPNPFHMQHYLSRAIAGVGLVIQEATAIEPNGRITDKDLGLWNDEQVGAISSVVHAVQQTGSKMFVQIAHAGRKSEVKQKRPLAASAIPFSSDYASPVEMSKQDIMDFRTHFKEAVKRSLEAGYDGIEIHAAHGYLISTFLSSASNHRTDEYGGSVAHRRRLLQEILEDIRSFYPKDKVLGVRVSAEDYVHNGMHVEEMQELLEPLVPLMDFVHVSSGGVDVNQKIPYLSLYQVKFAAAIKKHLTLPVIAVGRITTVNEAEYILKSGYADMVAFGRILLRDPFFLARKYPELTKKYHSYQRSLNEI